MKSVFVATTPSDAGAFGAFLDPDAELLVGEDFAPFAVCALDLGACGRHEGLLCRFPYI